MKPICLFLALAFGGKSAAWLIGAPEQEYQERQPLASASIKGFSQLGDRWRNTSFPRPLLVTFCL